MEGWSICYKALLLLYMAVDLAQRPTREMTWELLTLLVYICLNMIYYNWKEPRIRQSALVLAALGTAIGAMRLDPMFALLLPLPLCEWTQLRRFRMPYVALAAFLPALLVGPARLPLFGLVAGTGFMLAVMTQLFRQRLEALELENEKMRWDLERLTQELNESTEAIRQSEYTSRLEERNRLSQQIHDQIGHAMTGALIQMEAAKRLLASNGAKAEELLQNAIAISKDGIERIRQTLKSIKPPTEQLGINRLRLILDAFTGTHGIETMLTHEGNLEAITPLYWKIIQDNVGEALTNAAKYSGASRVEVEVTVLRTMIKAVVADNGKGAEKVVKGLGIVGIEERTASVNGTVIVDGSRGFQVTTLIPIGNPMPV